MKTLITGFAIAAFLLVGASNVLAQGATSSDDSTVTLDVNEVAYIEDAGDIGSTYTGGLADVEFGDASVCVYTNDADTTGGSTGLYRVKATSTTSQFRVQGPGTYTNNIPFKLHWNNSASSAVPGNVEFGPGATDYDTYKNASGANTTWAGGCGADNAGFAVEFTADDILDVPAGTYDAVLTLIVAPGNT